MIGLILALGALAGDSCLRPDVEWQTSLEAASEKARKEGKLVLMLHLSGILGNDDRT